MAQISKLAPYDDLTLIGNHAQRFAMDPDYVEENTSFNTVVYFAIEDKEKREFIERAEYIRSKLNEEIK